MARLMLIGDVAQVEILTDPEDEELVLAKCAGHRLGQVLLPPCLWEERYDTTGDAIEYAADHADRGEE